MVQLAISGIVSRFIRSESDYLLAGRTLGTFLATFSLFATWFGAETVIGSSGAIATGGLSASRADPFGYALCLLLMGMFLAKKLRQKNYVTIGDFFADNYGHKVEVLASCIMIPTSIIWAAAQIKAFALVVVSVSTIPIQVALISSTALIIAYTWLGGLLGDVVSDLIQSIVITIGLCILLFSVIQVAGGFEHAFGLIQFDQLSLLSKEETWLTQINTWAVPVMGSLVAPEALSRILATKSEKVAVRSSLLGAGVYLIVGLLPVLIALIGAHLMTHTGPDDAFLPALVKQFLPPWMIALLLGSIVSAILSTIDSTLLSIAGLASHNIILPALKQRHLSEKQKVLLTRLVVAFSGVLAYLIASGGESIYALVEAASAFGSAGFLICVLGGLYLPKISTLGAICVLVGGVVFTLLFDYALSLEMSYLLCLLGCLAIYLLFWIAEKPRQLAV